MLRMPISKHSHSSTIRLPRPQGLRISQDLSAGPRSLEEIDSPVRQEHEMYVSAEDYPAPGSPLRPVIKFQSRPRMATLSVTVHEPRRRRAV